MLFRSGVSGLRFFAIFFTSLNYVRFERSFSYIFSYFSLNLIFAAAIALIGWWLYDPYAKSAALQRPAYAAPAQPQRPTYTGAYAPQQTAYTAPAQPQQPTYTGAYAPQQTAYTPPMQPQRPVYPTYAAPAQPVYAQPYAPQQPSAKQSDEIERLKEYKALLDQGILTQEEFDQKKKELLGL